jgi:hypothetical protein
MQVVVVVVLIMEALLEVAELVVAELGEHSRAQSFLELALQIQVAVAVELALILLELRTILVEQVVLAS